MAGYMVYWPKEQLNRLKKAKDTGPIQVVLGSVHTKMPSIVKVKPGDVIYPVTLERGILYVLARLPVEQVESAFDYLVRETGFRHAALIPKGVAYEEDNNLHFIVADSPFYYDRAEDLPPEISRVETLADRVPVPHLCHQEPFNCCAETAASGSHGSSIEPRPLPAELIPTFRFGAVKSRQKPLKLNAKGELTTVSLSGFARKMSPETQLIFDAVFDAPRPD